MKESVWIDLYVDFLDINRLSICKLSLYVSYLLIDLMMIHKFYIFIWSLQS